MKVADPFRRNTLPHTVKTVSRCLHHVHEVIRILSLNRLGLGQFLLELLTSGVADGVIRLLERLPSGLSISDSILRFLALVTTYN